ncbi:hypothetical protein [Kitasatospora camelliae]|uniref:TadE-like protein n=1 Tax=Kitasatospora camelliae TaxID=3156397 RepID=A0AAU8K4U8_9ACTN
MTRIRPRTGSLLRPLLAALLLPVLLPVQLGMPFFHHRMGRVRAARAAGDRGAISIELALAVIVLVAIAGGVLAAVTALASKAKNKVPTDLPTAAQ